MSVALFGAGLALAAARVIGSQFEWVFFIPVGMAALVGFVGARLPIRFRVLANVLVFVGSAFVVAAAAKAPTSDVWKGLVSGPRQVLTTNWPSPNWPTICIALGSFVFIVIAVATDLAMRTRWRALAIAPLVLGLAAMLALGAPGGPQWAPLLCAAAATFALLWVGLDDRVVSLRAGVVVAVAIGVTAAATSVAVAASHRADPRFVEAAKNELALLDPLADVDAQRQAPPSQRYSVESAALSRLPRWRTAALDMYDGESWSASGRLAPVGNIVGSGTGAEQVVVKVSALTGTQLWPVPGALLRSAQSVATDADGRVVRIQGATRPQVNTFTIEPLLSFDPSTAGTMPIIVPSEIEASFQQRALALAPSGTVAEQIAKLASTLRDDYVLDLAKSAGVQQGLIGVFLSDEKAGNRAQFVTAFVLMARGLGVDARVAVGYRLPGSQGSSGQLTTSDAEAWAEVRVAKGWAAVDVVPQVSTESVQPPNAGARPDTPPAVQPAIVPEPERSKDNGSLQLPPVVGGSTRWGAIRAVAGRAGLGSVLLLWPVVVFAAVVRGKKRRRRRGLKSVDPARRVATAWTLATDALVDAGATLQASHTNSELVGAGVSTQPAAGPPLGRLQRHADAVTFATAACDDHRAADAVEQLRMIESSIAGSSSRWWRLKWTFSTRSLRRRTQSPLRRG